MFKEIYGGQGGIRTRDTFDRIHTFQACAFNRSATCPQEGYGVSNSTRQINQSLVQQGEVMRPREGMVPVLDQINIAIL